MLNDHILKQLEENPPKLIGGYKNQGWAVRVLNKIDNDDVEEEGNGLVNAKAILLGQDGLYYPAFITLDLRNDGHVVGIYLISESEQQFDLIPIEIAVKFLNKKESELLPFRYRTLVKIDGDKQQANWPEFT
ncbi:hypothetical protein HNR63_000241 [Anoxybacillus kamchatkensis]|uniref:hypothetical protein n=1 Tax=Anoxybacillus ayderensis TaxID=265546 RepID=UPI0015EBB537|nr:hypothetical protein [Anoxybacillus ayderensis]MBA2877214.1 hypothetical protein [Anoxybacillus ayderensis]